MTAINVELAGETAYIRFPSNHEVNSIMRDFKAEWDPRGGCWTVPLDDFEEIGEYLVQQGYEVEY